MKASEVYRKAAEMLANAEWPVCGAHHPHQVICRHSCCAVWNVCGCSNKPEQPWMLYADLFGNRSDPEWAEEWEGDINACRILALLLMSEIAKDSE